MKLSELVFQVVKNVKYLEDPNFDYKAFLLDLETYQNDQDYANSINNAYTPINEAIHRLSDRNKIAFVCQPLGKQKGGVVRYLIEDHPVKKIKAVFYMRGNDFVNVPYREMGKGQIFIMCDEEHEYYLQYIEDIKNFTANDYRYEQDEFTPVEIFDKDLSDYGINEDMCSYIIEYASAKLKMTIAPEIANVELNRAEQHFEDLEEHQTMFAQQRVSKKFSI